MNTYRMLSLLILAFCLARSLSCTSDCEISDGCLELGPGEGTILVVGGPASLCEVREVYKDLGAPAGPKIPNDSLWFGFITGWPKDRPDFDREVAAKAMLRAYRDFGATTVMAQDIAVEPDRDGVSEAQRFIDGALAIDPRYRVILQPKRLFWNPWHYWNAKRETADPSYTPRLITVARSLSPAINTVAGEQYWQLTEELQARFEAEFSKYKRAWTLGDETNEPIDPEARLFQIDSVALQEPDLERKLPPLPDFLGFNDQLWATRPGHTNLRCRDGETGGDLKMKLFTPYYGMCASYDRYQVYARAATKVLADGGPLHAVRVEAAAGILDFPEPSTDPDKPNKSWDACLAARKGALPKAPTYTWHTRDGDEWCAEWSKHQAPTNSWRAQSWLAITAGFKGLMFWSPGPVLNHGPTELATAWRTGKCTGGGTGNSCARPTLFYWDGEAVKAWRRGYLSELAQTWNNINSYRSLIWELLLTDRAADFIVDPEHLRNDRNVYVGSFEDTTLGKDFLVVTNTDIGTWDVTSPTWADDEGATITVDAEGQLVPFVPARAERQIRLPLTLGTTLHDLRDHPSCN